VWGHERLEQVLRQPTYDLTGQRFGRLTVESFQSAPGNHKERQGSSRGGLWKCVCDCGNIRYNRSGDLRMGRIVSCGCFRDERNARNQEHVASLDPDRIRINKKRKRKPKDQWKKRRYDHARTEKNTWLRVYRYAAARRGLEFLLSTEQAYKLASQNCAYCEAEPEGKHWPHNGIDRVNNDLGYTPDNTVSCCSLCNRMKGELSSVDFVDQCGRIFTRNGKPLQEVSYSA